MNSTVKLVIYYLNSAYVYKYQARIQDFWLMGADQEHFIWG